MAPEFVHLHVHSEYSLLDGLGRVNHLVKQAAALGQRAMALTDHGTMHGVIEFSRACHKAGIKPIIGVEAYLTRDGRPMTGRDPQLDKDRHHLLLLAENQAGYRNLLKICSHAQTEGYYYRPRVDKDFLAAHAAGLICTSGCLAAEIPWLLNRGKEREAVERLHWYRDVFGAGRYFIELQEHSIPELEGVNKQLVDFSRRYDLPMVATNDVHYVKPGDASFHDVLLCVQTTAAVTAKDRMRMSDGSYYVRSAEEMDALFGKYPGALSNSLLIADMCNVDVEDREYHLPPFSVPPGHDYQSWLRELAEEGLRARYGERSHDEDVRARLEHELKVIHEMGFDVYFLIVGDLCRYARTRGIWYNVRGSGAGSLVAYVTGITNLDPLPNNLIFERFLNPGRVSMPDFDLDFPDDQREEMIRYTIDTYGEDQVAQIVTFGRMKARAAVRDVGRAMEIPLSEVDQIAKMIPAIPGKPISIHEALAQIPDLQQAYQGRPQVRELLDTAGHIEGVARHGSIHAAAVIVADKPLINYTPLMRPPKSAITRTITQYEFPILESIGLLKVDFLGLSTLSVMREATRLIAERHGTQFTLDNIPLDDPEAYRLLASGEVTGVFQVEGTGMRRVLMEMQPSEFNHIVATISLYRPGPMDFIPEYIACLHGKKTPSYVHPALEPILGETFGVCVSGDAVVTNARTGQDHRLAELEHVEDLWVQGVDPLLRPAVGRVTDFIFSGHKQVWRMTLAGGAQIKLTPDHRVLTPAGWQSLSALKVGDQVATPAQRLTLEPDSVALLAPWRVNPVILGFNGNVVGSAIPNGDTPSSMVYAGQGVIWQTIAALEPLGVEAVYDLTVAGLHNFVADGVVVHNCIYQEQIIQLLTLVAGYTAGEADLVRRAISKKKADVIEKERASFARGAAATSGLTHAEADQIWDALQGFARYGFNRAHAADYAVICVQTAYLKAHYPLEFMAAQLLVERDKSDKVTNFITECRRMGIEVLPPSINSSGLDFTIEQRAAGAPPPVGQDSHIAYRFPVPPGAAIRFGLAAIKNVGEGPVETILEARAQAGRFAGLEDFCQQVDLRKVSRRPLECLIKAGALDEFGERGQLLAVIEQMLGESSSAHDARAVGQMSIFDLFGGSSGPALSIHKILLPDTEPVKMRECLNWEKELLGVYASSHPLQQLAFDTSDLVTCSAGEVDRTLAGRPVTLIGMLTEIKPIVTKKGDPMAFATMEDLTGNVELTIFPRVYADIRDDLALEKVVLVRGRVDAREGGRISVLVDNVQDYVDRARVLAEAGTAAGNGYYNRPFASPPRPAGANGGSPVPGPSPFQREGPIVGAWYDFNGDDDDGDDTLLAEGLSEEDDEEIALAPEPAVHVLEAAAPAPDAQLPLEVAAPVRRLEVTFRRSGDLEADKRRLQVIYDTMLRYRDARSQDLFHLVLLQDDRRLKLEFPNDRTRYCSELREELVGLVGWDGLRVATS